jgi:anti-sigma regulatory factor (Ser/Thr protein kinase)
MTSGGFQHRALIYEGADEYLAGTVPFLWAALEAEEPVLVAVGETRAEMLRAELGGDARWVNFLSIGEIGRNPAAAIPLWRNFVDENDGGPVRGIGEPVQGGRGTAALEEIHRNESLLHLVFAEDPAFSLLCPYDASALPDEALGRVAASHRFVQRGGRIEESADFEPRADRFAGRLPSPSTTPETIDFGLAELADVRRRVAEVAERAGLCPREVADLVTAAGELAANSVMHGGGVGTLRIWRESGSLLTEVTDRGLIEDQLVGHLRPAISQEGGRGLWLANQLCDLVQIRSDDQGTAVRLHVPAHDRGDTHEVPAAATDPRAEAETSNA